MRRKRPGSDESGGATCAATDGARATGAGELTFAVMPVPAIRRTSWLLPNMMRAKLRFDMTASERSSLGILHLSILR
ncbi:MAG: hypothetical protein ABSE19_09310 [Candidatus Acidiferrum sp.]